MTKKQIKNLEILGELSKGGMGKLYKAYHKDLEKEVVLKQILVESEEAAIRFKNEAKVLIDLHHENIVPVFDYFQDNNEYYILMDFVDGKNLREIIENYEQIPEKIVLLILYQILQGLEYIHKKGIIHRDLKPDNIIIGKDGVVKIVDFGIAYSEEKTGNVTREGYIIGTPKYIAPEAYQGYKPDFSFDIYATGIILYELLAGKNPFDGLDESSMVQSKLKGKLPPISRYNKNASKFLSSLAYKMTNRKPGKRPSASRVLKMVEKKLSLIDLNKMEELLKEYFFAEADKTVAATVVAQVETKKDKVEEKLKKTIDYINLIKRISLILVIGIVSLFIIGGIYVLFRNNYIQAFFLPSHYAPMKIEIKTSYKDPYFNKLLYINVDGKSFRNGKFVIIKKHIMKIEIFYRGIYIYKEFNPLSYKELSKIRKAIRKEIKIFGFIKIKIKPKKEDIVYIKKGENYLRSNFVDNKLKINQLIISEIYKFAGRGGYIRVLPYDMDDMGIIKDFKLFMDTGKSKILMNSGYLSLKSFVVNFEIFTLDYYMKKIKNLHLSTNNYIYPLMMKKSGLVVIKSKINGVSILLNGSSKGEVGEEKRVIKDYGLIQKGKKILHLPPGVYYPAFKYNGRVYAFEPFILKPDGVIEIQLIWKNNTIEDIKIKK